MARSEIILGKDDIEEAIFDEFTIDNEKTESEKKVDAFADALKDDPNSFVNVSRQLLGGNSPMEFVGRYPADKYDFGELLALMQEKYGPGDYRFMLYAKGKLRANKLFSIAAPKKDHFDARNYKNSDNADSMRILAQMMEQQTRMIMDALKGGNSRKEWLEEMTMYKTLFGGNDNKSALTELQNSINMLETLGIEVGGKKEEESIFPQLIEKVGDVIKTASEQQTQYQNNPQQRQGNNMGFFLKMGMKQLLQGAARNSDPGVYAQLIIDNLPEEKIREFFTEQGALEKVMNFEPKLRNFKPWVVLLGEHVKAILGMESSVSDEYPDLTTEEKTVNNSDNELSPS